MTMMSSMTLRLRRDEQKCGLRGPIVPWIRCLAERWVSYWVVILSRLVLTNCLSLGEELERGGEVHEAAGDHYHQHHHQHQHIPTKYDQQTSVVLVESNDASPKPIIRGLNKDKRPIPRWVTDLSRVEWIYKMTQFFN